MVSETRITIRGTSPPERCEICHQSDVFNPTTEYCKRCSESSDEMTLAALKAKALDKKRQAHFGEMRSTMLQDFDLFVFHNYGLIRSELVELTRDQILLIFEQMVEENRRGCINGQIFLWSCIATQIIVWLLLFCYCSSFYNALGIALTISIPISVIGFGFYNDSTSPFQKSVQWKRRHIQLEKEYGPGYIYPLLMKRTKKSK